MTWISLVCLLALSSSAFGSPYGGYSGSSFPQVPSIISTMREKSIQPEPFLPTLPVQSGYGQPRNIELTSNYGGSVVEKFLPPPLIQTGYGQPRTIELTPNYGGSVVEKFLPPPVQTGYGSSIEVRPLTRVFPTQGYGQGYGSSSPRVIQFDQTPLPPPQIILTPADMLCQGQPAETVIPIEDNRKFVVCIGDNKGVEQSCPRGLFYHTTSRRCERKLGPLENVCASQPCLNGGQCVPTESWYQCQCAPGYDGHLCEFDAHYCQTQSPCGQSSDARCQSFRWGAALQWVCIFQDGLAYGLSSTQVQPSPCGGIDGPQALAVSNKGFIMCDGERMHVESCPGGTIWDDLNKACTWPDMQGVIGVPQLDQPSGYGQTTSYGQTRTITPEVTTYGGGYGTPRLLEQPTYGGKVGMHRHHHLGKPKFFEQSGYGSQERTLIQPSGYGAPLETRIMPKLVEPMGYGASQEFRPFPKLIQIQPSGGYGGQPEPRLIDVQPQGYGGQPEPRLIELQPKGYGGQPEFKPEIIQVKKLSGY